MNDVTELKLTMPLQDMQNIFGGNDSYIRKIEENLHVEIIDRNGELHVIGGREEVTKASGIIHQLSKLSGSGSAIEEQSVDYAISLKKEEPHAQEVLLRELCETMTHGSLCAMGGMTPYPVLSALEHYPADFGIAAPTEKAA